MTSLFPPVLENPGIAFPSSTWGGNLEISFLVPDINNISEIKHVQVIIKYRSNNTPALDTKYLPDRMTLFLTRDQTSHNVIYDAETSQMRIIIPYKCFDKGYPKENTEYSIQVRFGNGAMWDGYRDFTTNFTNFAAWRKEQISKVLSGFGEWSNSQTRYCYGSISTGFDYNLDDFVPEIVFNFNTEEDNPDTLRQCQIEYTYGNITRTKILDGIIDEDGNGSVRFKIPVAPIGASPIKVHLKAITTYNVILEDDLNILSLVGSSVKKEDKLITNEKVHFEELVLKGPELEDGCIAKKLVYNDGVSTLNNIGVAIYRINCYTLETIKVADFDSRFLDIYNYRLKDFSVEMGEEYQYVAVAKNLKTGKASSIISALYPFGEQNSGYGRIMRFDATYLCDKNHQLRLQGNVSVSSFKRNTTDNFQTTIGSEYPFYSRTTANNYRTFQISSLVTINTDPTATFLINEPVNGLIWQDDNEKRLMILNRDLYSNEQISLSRRRRVKNGNGADIVEYGKEEPNDVIETGCDTEYEDRYHQDIQSLLGTSLTDNVVFAERKFREQVMKWLSDGKPKLFRSETEGNMIVMLSGVSFSPFEKSGRAVYTMSATCTEIAECDMNNLIDYDLMPMDISTQVLGQLTSNVRPGEIVGDVVRNVVVYMAEDLKDNFQEYSDTTFKVKKDANIAKINQILESITKYSYIPGNIQYPIGREWEYRNIETGIIGDSFPALRLYKSTDWEIDENVEIFDEFWTENGEPKEINLIPNWLFTIKKEHKSSVIEKLNFTFLPTANLPNGLAIRTEKVENTDDDSQVMYTDINVWLYIDDYVAASKPRPGVMSILKITDSGRPEATQYVPIYFGPVFEKLQFISLNNHILNNAFVGDEVNFDIINKIKGGIPFYDENGESYYSIESQNLPSNLILQNGKIQGNIADIYTSNENEFWISIKDSFGHYVDQKITYGPVYGIVRANADEINLGILYKDDDVKIDLTQYVDNIAGGSWQVNGTGIETPEAWQIPTNNISSVKQIYTIKYKNNIALDFDDERGATSFNIVVDQVVAAIKFENYQIPNTGIYFYDIRPKNNADAMIPLGEELTPIDLTTEHIIDNPNYNLEEEENEETNPKQIIIPAAVSGGVPPYKFIEMGDFKPDYSLSSKGVISGTAKIGRDYDAYPTFKIEDSNGRVLTVSGGDSGGPEDKIRIYPIQDTIKLITGATGIYEFNNGGNIAYNSLPIFIDILYCDFTGGFPFQDEIEEIGTLEYYKILVEDAWKENLTIDYYANGGYARVTLKNQKGTLTHPRTVIGYIYDKKNNKVAITLKIPRIYEELSIKEENPQLELNPALDTFVKVYLNTLHISGGLPPYTLSISSTSEIPLPDYLKIYQGEGGEQDFNKIYIGGTATEADSQIKNIPLVLKDSLEQQLDITLNIGQVKDKPNIEISDTIKKMSKYDFIYGISSTENDYNISLIQSNDSFLIFSDERLNDLQLITAMQVIQETSVVRQFKLKRLYLNDYHYISGTHQISNLKSLLVKDGDYWVLNKTQVPSGHIYKINDLLIDLTDNQNNYYQGYAISSDIDDIYVLQKIDRILINAYREPQEINNYLLIKDGDTQIDLGQKIYSPRIVEAPRKVNIDPIGNRKENEMLVETQVFEANIGLGDKAHKNLVFKIKKAGDNNWITLENNQPFDLAANLYFNTEKGCIYSPGLGQTDEDITYYIKPVVVDCPLLKKDQGTGVGYIDFNWVWDPSDNASLDNNNHIAKFTLNAVASETSFYLTGTKGSVSETSLSLDYGNIGAKSDDWSKRIYLTGTNPQLESINYNAIQLMGISKIDIPNSTIDVPESQQDRWFLEKLMVDSQPIISLTRKDSTVDAEEFNFNITLRNVSGKEVNIKGHFKGVYDSGSIIMKEIPRPYQDYVIPPYVLPAQIYLNNFKDIASGGSGFYGYLLCYGGNVDDENNKLIGTHLLTPYNSVFREGGIQFEEFLEYSPDYSTDDGYISDAILFVWDSIWEQPIIPSDSTFDVDDFTSKHCWTNLKIGQTSYDNSIDLGSLINSYFLPTKAFDLDSFAIFDYFSTIGSGIARDYQFIFTENQNDEADYQQIVFFKGSRNDISEKVRIDGKHPVTVQHKEDGEWITKSKKIDYNLDINYMGDKLEPSSIHAKFSVFDYPFKNIATMDASDREYEYHIGEATRSKTWQFEKCNDTDDWKIFSSLNEENGFYNCKALEFYYSLPTILYYKEDNEWKVMRSSDPNYNLIQRFSISNGDTITYTKNGSIANYPDDIRLVVYRYLKLQHIKNYTQNNVVQSGRYITIHFDKT